MMLNDPERLYALRCLSATGVPSHPSNIGIAKRALDVLAGEGLVRDIGSGWYEATREGLNWMQSHGGPFRYEQDLCP